MTVSYQNEVASSTSGGFTRLLLKWRGSLYKLIYRELLLFCLAYTAVSLIYFKLLTVEQQRSVAAVTGLGQRTVADVPGLGQRSVAAVPGLGQRTVAAVPGLGQRTVAAVPGLGQRSVAVVPRLR